MNETSTHAATVPPTPGEQEEARQDTERLDVRVPSVEATPDQAASAGVDDPSDGDLVRSGVDAGELVAEVDAATTHPADDTELVPAVPAETPSIAALASGEVEVECPSCALVVVGDSPRPTAAWFCPRCDYPLFWASPPPPSQAPSTRARKRLPGTRGRAVVGAEPCWYCGEMNAPDGTACFRCAASLPKPAPPVPTIDLPVEPKVIRELSPVTLVTWPYVTAAGLAGLSLGSAVALWLAGLG